MRRERLLRPSLEFSWSITVGDKPSGRIGVTVQTDALFLSYEWRPPGTTQWTRGSQRVTLRWIPCNFGGARPWFECSSVSVGYGCGRRVAKLYLDGHVFACRQCCGLAYASQSENVRDRAMRRARKIRRRLGGELSLLDRFPGKPARMHRRTYHRLFAKAMAAQERSFGLEIEDIRRRFPGLLPPPALARRASGDVKFFTPRALAAENGRGRAGPR